MKRQCGATGLFVAIVIALMVAALLATLQFLQVNSQGERVTSESTRFDKIKAALVQFAAANSRLPCPATPTADTGDAAPTTASATCTSPTGTVPWKTLGLRRDDAVDSAGWKISYRVYTGAGSLTQAGGASMVDCDTVESAPAGLTAAGLCKSTKDTLDTQFFTGKGLTVTWFGTSVTDAAFVLISHGSSGLGAYTASSTPTQKTLPTNASELANTTATGPFVATSPSAASVGPSDATHFDDLLAYMKISDLVRQSGLSARDWPDPPPSGVQSSTMNSATVAAALGSTPTAGSDLGVSSLTFGNIQITGYTGSTAQNLTFASTSDGIGTGGGAQLSIQSARGDSVRLDVAGAVTALGVTLNQFGTSGVRFERVRFDFYNGTTLVSSTTKEACLAGNGATSFSINLGSTTFTRADIVPLTPVTPTAGGSTTFYLASFATCTTTPCNSPGYSVLNACP